MKANIEQHKNDNKKTKLKPELQQAIGNALALDPTSLEQFVYVLELPDAAFDAIYPTYKERVKGLFENTDAQRDLISQMKMNPLEDLKMLRAELSVFLSEITDDESLSENKKDLISSIFTNSADIAEEILKGGCREYIKVKITKLDPEAIIPQYAHPTDAGADVYAVEETTIAAGETKIVKTGIAVAIPVGYEIQVRPRSGLSLKSGLRIANAPGTIDADYRGEIGIIMTNTKDIPYVIDKGMKIAQLVISPVPRIKWEEVETVEDLGTTERGEGGFGSTGVKS